MSGVVVVVAIVVVVVVVVVAVVIAIVVVVVEVLPSLPRLPLPLRGGGQGVNMKSRHVKRFTQLFKNGKVEMERMLCGVDLAVQLVAFYIQLYHYFVDSNWTDQDSNWTDQSLFKTPSSLHLHEADHVHAERQEDQSDDDIPDAEGESSPNPACVATDAEGLPEILEQYR